MDGNGVDVVLRFTVHGPSLNVIRRGKAQGFAGT